MSGDQLLQDTKVTAGLKKGIFESLRNVTGLAALTEDDITITAIRFVSRSRLKVRALKDDDSEQQQLVKRDVMKMNMKTKMRNIMRMMKRKMKFQKGIIAIADKELKMLQKG